MEDHTLLLFTSVLVLVVVGTMPLIKSIMHAVLMIIGIVGLINLNLIPLDTNENLAFLSSVKKYVSLIQFTNKKLNIRIPTIEISLTPQSHHGCQNVMNQITNEFGNKEKKRA